MTDIDWFRYQTIFNDTLDDSKFSKSTLVNKICIGHKFYHFIEQ